MAYVMLPPYTACLRPARRLQTSANMGALGIRLANSGGGGFWGALKTGVQAFADTAASVKQLRADTKNDSPAPAAAVEPSGTNFLSTMPNSTLAVGGIAAAALVFAMAK